jgi:ribonuclease HI
VTITAAADGSALGNPGPAGWAWYIDDDRWAAGGWKHGTNNMGELKAVLELFRATSGVDDDLLVLCDSQYVINSVTSWMPGWKRRGWRKADGKPVLNVELLKELDEAITGRRYRFEWVKGHVGHELNEAADERARAVATAYQRGTAVPSGPGFSPSDGTPPPAPTVIAAATPAAASLFELPDGPGPSRSVTVELAADEWARLERRARRAGLSPEELLRDLAARS